MIAALPLADARIAIANRGEIAVRVAATCRRLGATPVLLLGDPDLDGYAARQVGRVEPVGEAGSELDVARVVAAARRADAAFLHPGYGFLSERADLAAACAEAGIRFVGPSVATLRVCGDKPATRAAAEGAGVPVPPASQPLGDDPAGWRDAARRVGFPLLVKPAAAGGGRGLRRAEAEDSLAEAVVASRQESTAAGAGNLVYLEREVVDARHVEVQVVADGRRTLVLGDRDCSLQRRNQKVIEEAPAPHVDDATRRALHHHARRIAEAVDLVGIATCEFLLGADGTLAFLEVNPRIQVEHPVTEEVTGVDLVAWQLAIAAGDGLPDGAPAPRGHAIEARIYAEDPAAGFFPAAGRLATVAWPARPDVRIDAGYASGDVVPAAYDPLLAKVIARGPDRDAALSALRIALLETAVAGLPTNLPWLLDLLDRSAVRAGRATTRTAGDVPPTTPDRTLALLAAVAHALDHRPVDVDADPWSVLGPFRVSGAAALTFHGDGWEERVAVRRARADWEIAVGGAPIHARWWRDPGGVWTIAAAGEVAKLAVVEGDDGIEIAGHGGRWLVRSGPRPSRASGRRVRPADGRVRAPLPGKVLRLHVAPDDRVARGQSLVTLGAMKMELGCDAPADGVVEAVSCRVDDLVAAGDLLVELRLVDADEPDP